jgi:RNA polymerase sigma-70 factor, ECF subfamily
MFSSISKTTSSIRFEELCARHRPDVFRFALSLARDRAIAEDVVQETFMRAWRAIDSLADQDAARSWLLTIARREHARLYERRRYPTVDIDDLVVANDPALASAPSEDHSYLGEAISSLDAGYRKPLMLQAFMGYSIEEIACHMSLTKSAVLTRLHRARQKLRIALGTTGVPAASSTMGTTKATHRASGRMPKNVSTSLGRRVESRAIDAKLRSGFSMDRCKGSSAAFTAGADKPSARPSEERSHRALLLVALLVSIDRPLNRFIALVLSTRPTASAPAGRWRWLSATRPSTFADIHRNKTRASPVSVYELVVSQSALVYSAGARAQER